jgi:hypothetical protein
MLKGRGAGRALIEVRRELLEKIYRQLPVSKRRPIGGAGAGFYFSPLVSVSGHDESLQEASETQFFYQQ